MRMTRSSIPLYVKFLAWAGVNVLLLGVLLYLYAPHESGLNLLLTSAVRDRLAAVGREIADDLYQVDPAQWQSVLDRYDENSEVKFTAREVGRPPPRDPSSFDPVPPELPPGSVPPVRPPANDAPEPPLEGPSAGRWLRNPRAIGIVRAPHGNGFEVSIHAEGARHSGPPRLYVIGADAPTLWILLRFLGIGRMLLFAVLLLTLSALLWWPFIWGITRSIGRLSHATELMARGRLETRVFETRRDELGNLANAVNTMAERLEIIISGQRQFIADVAHEVISPVARMQIGLGILEGRMGERAATALNDVREDLEQMAGMLNELLLFSRSGLEVSTASPVAVALRPLVEKLVAREAEGAAVEVHIAESLCAEVHPTMLARALANLLRNARRYGAGTEHPVEVSAVREADRVRITVSDRGPGVPESALARLGEPFFRPDLARTRASGGFGLGLAIVRRCIVACNGEVILRNRPGGGFEAELIVPLAQGD